MRKSRTSPQVQEGNERCKMQSRGCAASPYIGSWIHPRHRRVSPWLPKACAFGMDACQDGNLLSFSAVNTPLPWRVYHQHQPLTSLSKYCPASSKCVLPSWRRPGCFITALKVCFSLPCANINTGFLCYLSSRKYF